MLFLSDYVFVEMACAIILSFGTKFRLFGIPPPPVHLVLNIYKTTVRAGIGIALQMQKHSFALVMGVDNLDFLSTWVMICRSEPLGARIKYFAGQRNFD